MVNQCYQPSQTCIKSALPSLLSDDLQNCVTKEDSVAPPFTTLRYGNAANPGACAYYGQDASVKETIDKRIKLGQLNGKIPILHNT